MKMKSSPLNLMRPLLADRKDGMARELFPYASLTGRSQRGVALVITLIMLSVTLVMAVAFLAISRRDNASVSTTTDAIAARLAADSALSSAEFQIIANLTVNSNLNSFSLLVSTNYINPLGFTNGNNASANPTNVNYANTINSGSPSDLAQNIANLQILPRAPVLLSSNEPLGRYYLDLNRNGAFDPNGWQPQFADIANGIYLTNGASVGIITNFMVGDPEWIGVLERPDAPHGPDNKFIARYAFIAQPIGNTLDFNYIHNQARNHPAGTSMSSLNDGYFRNQGIGSWELNLAAFLADLNTNMWGQFGAYQYRQPQIGSPANVGLAFNDAFSILTNRYAGNYSTLPSAKALFNLNNNAAYQNFWFDDIDEYSDGPLQITPENVLESVGSDDTTLPWLGADSTNRYFVLDDLLNTNFTAGFGADLANIGTGNSTYNRYTYYRMLDQIGVDSAAESGKLNLNYNNLIITPTNSVASVTNFIPWTPSLMFSNVADRLLRAYTVNWYQENPSNFLAVYYGIRYPFPLDQNGVGLTNYPYFGITNQVPSFGITNIPVIYASNVVYASSVNRLLQLAANIVDATTTNFYPSVFKPIFYHPANGSLAIGGFVSLGDGYQVDGRFALFQEPEFSSIDNYARSLTDVTIKKVPNFIVYGPSIYGVPWIFGAKKGFPNFNEFSFENITRVTRKLQLIRQNVDSPPIFTHTNQMIILSVTNKLGVEFWNSYTNQYLSQNLRIYVSDVLSASVKLTNGVVLLSPYIAFNTNVIATPSGGFWPSNQWDNTLGTLRYNNTQAILVPLDTTTGIVTNEAYSSLFQGFGSEDNTNNWEDALSSPLGQILLQTTNYMRSALVDNRHIIDYVQFDGPSSSTNITSLFAVNKLNVNQSADAAQTNMWSTWLVGPGPLGIYNQIKFSSEASTWAKLNAQNQKEVNKFSVFLKGPASLGNIPYGAWPVTAYNDISNLVAQAPYTPTVTIRDYSSWQANDPLIHYIVSDLMLHGPIAAPIQPGINIDLRDYRGNTDTNIDLPNLGQINDRYEPWGRTGIQPSEGPTITHNSHNVALQDPLVWTSDFWDFPTNKFPSVGWLGRVHRGTPWQTVYLKSQSIQNQPFGGTIWQIWTENYNPLEAVNTLPVQDRWLFDLFTTAPDDNATRGRLSVNQKNLAAWSALFSGMVALQNTNGTSFPGYQYTYAWTNLSPAGIDVANSALGQIVDGPYGINSTRTNFPSAAFQHVGDILATPALTDQSPFINTNFAGLLRTNGVTDAVYEWLPQQAMSLLKLDDAPRYVIYCYGQALKPVQGAQVTSGANFGLVTNYQIMAESAARAVIQVHAHVFVDFNSNLNKWVSTTNYTTTVESYNVLPPN